ncbi:MAG: HAD-IIB family hydrolase [Alphaproteobacteria bacterium]
MKKLIVFDLDGTLAESKAAIDETMSGLLGRLLKVAQVAIISGGAWSQYEKQVLANLPKGVDLTRLSLLPTCGTKFFRYETGVWTLLYSEDFSGAEKERIVDALNGALDASGLRPEKPWGALIDDRGSQITLSALGQDTPLDVKKGWDADFKKRDAIKAHLTPALDNFSVRAGGETSIDVTRLGIDKAYGIEKLHEVLSIDIQDMLFVGDALQPGGNDYPARKTGDCIAVRGPEVTKSVIETIIACVQPPGAQ